jgi:hypothetical protein
MFQYFDFCYDDVSGTECMNYLFLYDSTRWFQFKTEQQICFTHYYGIGRLYIKI